MAYTKAKTKTTVPPMSEEEKQQQIARFFGQKKESFVTGILFNLCNGLGNVPTTAEGKALVDRAIEMSDHLLDSLYAPKEENK